MFTITLPYVPDAEGALQLAKELDSDKSARFPELEAIIATSAYQSLVYALTVLYERFEQGEAMIATNPDHAYQYAKRIIKGAWPEGEAVIATECDTAYNYAMYIKKAPFPEGEKVIAADANRSYDYARWILKGRFEQGEAAITANATLKKFYYHFLDELGIYTTESILKQIAETYNVSIEVVKDIAKLYQQVGIIEVE